MLSLLIPHMCCWLHPPKDHPPPPGRVCPRSLPPPAWPKCLACPWSHLLLLPTTNGLACPCLLQLQDLDQVYESRLKARDAANAQLSVRSLQEAMQRCLPYPCHQRYTAVAMLPQQTLVNRILSRLSTIAPANSGAARYWLLATAVGTVGAIVAARLWRKRK